MGPIKRIAAVNDLSGFGRCSLTVSVPILSAMGFQVCPLPTAVLSAHTGYPDPLVRDFTDDMEGFLRHWESLGLTFDCGYTGYLGNRRQADILEPFLRRLQQQGAWRLVDPAMADHGKMYASCSTDLIPAMARLVSLASVATPNLTEACLLTDSNYDAVMQAPDRREAVAQMARRILSAGCGAVVITGVESGNFIENCVLSDGDAEPVWVCGYRVDRHFAGTGDVFASVLCGWLLRGMPLVDAVGQAAAFVCETTEATAQWQENGQDGIAFEPFLYKLSGDDNR
ncbi:MAG: pyridoxamine kinase [Clostridia bacterium]|nr:pyridoxamine kinase [Clostridia bacterium]